MKSNKRCCRNNYLISGLHVTRVEVPKYLLVGQKATLKCHVDLAGEKLYSLTWWRDDSQFYQYNPRNNPPAVVFTVPGISVNVRFYLITTIFRKLKLYLLIVSHMNLVSQKYIHLFS